MNDCDNVELNKCSSDPHPSFHITGGKGWINDPNAPVFFNGLYHVFYQYHPYSTVWGPMHWGHAVSADLTHWQTLPIALFPGGDGDKDGCFSGTALVYNGKLYLMYTGFSENGGGENIRQVQCLAESEDGVSFLKRGVVIGSEDLPEGYSPCDFRDPKLFEKDGVFYCIVAAKYKDGHGRLLSYRSDDLIKWTFMSDVLGFSSYGIMFECPDYIDDLGLILCCDQLPPSGKGGCKNRHSARYFTGKFDFSCGKFEVKSEGIVDYGFDYYAPQSFAGASDTVIAWLNMWDRNVPSAKYGFAGMLTVPRKIFVKEGVLYSSPIVEKVLTKTETGNEISDNASVAVLEIEAENLKEFSLELRSGKDCSTTVKLVGGEWVFDRSMSGEKIVGAEEDEDSLRGVRRMPWSGDKKTRITVVMDRFSIEFFEGGKVMSNTVYPPFGADGIRLCAVSDNLVYKRYDIE